MTTVFLTYFRGILVCLEKVLEDSKPSYLKLVHFLTHLLTGQSQNLYSKFIYNLSFVCIPFINCGMIQSELSWTLEKGKAFNLTKTFSTSNSHFELRKLSFSHVMPPVYSIRAYLSHGLCNGSERPIGFTSWILSPAEWRLTRRVWHMYLEWKGFIRNLYGQSRYIKERLVMHQLLW